MMFMLKSESLWKASLGKDECWLQLRRSRLYVDKQQTLFIAILVI